MKLIIDIGNSETKLALFSEKKMERFIRHITLSFEDIEIFIKEKIIQKVIISSVKKNNPLIKRLKTEYDVMILDHHTDIPINNMYKTPESLGKDRLAAVVGASYLYKKKNILIVDLGTCLTFDIINSEKEYIGGRISPGLKMRYLALPHYTDNLPSCDIKRTEKKIGDDTFSSIHTGIQQGMIDELNSFIEAFIKENQHNIVVITGGDYIFFEKALKNTIFAHPFLVLEGLNEILDYND